MAVTINVKLKPRASKCAIKVISPKEIEVSVTSPPIDNRANDHLIDIIASTLKIAKSSVSIIKGGHSRNKVVSINNISEDELFRQLSSR